VIGYRIGCSSLIRTVSGSLSGYNRSRLAWLSNQLSYPETMYANLRGGMQGE
jgi:hypothetical protein